MALTFPLTLAEFWDLLPIEDVTFDLPEMVVSSRTQGGELLRAERGSRLWQGSVTLAVMTREEAARVLPLLNVLRGAASSFLVCDPLRPGPRADERGTVLGASVPKIAAYTARTLDISGLPAGYVLARGDMVAWSYGSNPVRRALHEVVTLARTASATGVMDDLEVVPPIRAGTLSGSNLSLIKASCKATLVPGSVEPGRGRRGGVKDRTSFRWQQTLR